MKYLAILQILLSCVAMTAISQIENDDCSQYINTIDSLIKKGKLDIYRYNHPPMACEHSLLDYTKGKGFLGDSISTDISNIFDFLSESGILQTTRKQAINELLLRNYHFDVDANYQFHKEDFNNQALLRLKDLLQKRYTRTEEMRYIQDDAKYMLEENSINILSKREAQKRNISYEIAKDSIINSIKNESRIRLYKEGYSIHLPLLIGWFDFKEFIPLLDSIQNVDGDVSFQIALARMGNKKYQDYFLQFDNIDLPIAFYIGTQDLIAKYGEKLYSEEKKLYISGPPDFNEKIPVKYNIIIDLQNNIANFPKLIDRKFYLWFQKDIDALPPDVVEKARQWMKENKGIYFVSSNFIPDFNNLILDKYRRKP